MLRRETRGRARALQLLYAWEVGGGVPLPRAATGVARLVRPRGPEIEDAEVLASGVLAALPAIDRLAAAAADNWRLDRLGVVERNILRIGIAELQNPDLPPKVAIDEGVRLAHWFAGARAPAFVNGVLDRVARQLGRL